MSGLCTWLSRRGWLPSDDGEGGRRTRSILGLVVILVVWVVLCLSAALLKAPADSRACLGALDWFQLPVNASNWLPEMVIDGYSAAVDPLVYTPPAYSPAASPRTASASASVLECWAAGSRAVLVAQLWVMRDVLGLCLLVAVAGHAMYSIGVTIDTELQAASVAAAAIVDARTARGSAGAAASPVMGAVGVPAVGSEETWSANVNNASYDRLSPHIVLLDLGVRFGHTRCLLVAAAALAVSEFLLPSLATGLLAALLASPHMPLGAALIALAAIIHESEVFLPLSAPAALLYTVVAPVSVALQGGTGELGAVVVQDWAPVVIIAVIIAAMAQTRVAGRLSGGLAIVAVLALRYIWAQPGLLVLLWHAHGPWAWVWHMANVAVCAAPVALLGLLATQGITAIVTHPLRESPGIVQAVRRSVVAPFFSDVDSVTSWLAQREAMNGFELIAHVSAIGMPVVVLLHSLTTPGREDFFAAMRLYLPSPVF